MRPTILNALTATNTLFSLIVARDSSWNLRSDRASGFVAIIVSA